MIVIRIGNVVSHISLPEDDAIDPAANPVNTGFLVYIFSSQQVLLRRAVKTLNLW